MKENLEKKLGPKKPSWEPSRERSKKIEEKNLEKNLGRPSVDLVSARNEHCLRTKKTSPFSFFSPLVVCRSRCFTCSMDIVSRSVPSNGRPRGAPALAIPVVIGIMCVFCEDKPRSSLGLFFAFAERSGGASLRECFCRDSGCAISRHASVRRQGKGRA